MKKICWLATGGTIASRPGSDGLVPGFTAAQMLELMPELKQYGIIDCYDIMELDSTNLQPKDWQYIAGRIEKLYGSYDGFVITHGTDTLNWTCCALTFMLENLAKPIAVIGSQLTIEEDHTDARRNLNAAFALAAKDCCGVYAVCGGQIIPGLWAKKLYSEDLRSIQSVNAAPYAVFDDESIQWNKVYENESKPSGAFTVHSGLEEKVCQVKIMPGLNSAMLYALADSGYKAIVLEAYGAGGIPFGTDDPAHDITAAAAELTKRGIIIACTTQCLYDGVHMQRYEVGIKACRAGIIPAGKLTTEAATVLLMTALGQKMNLEQIKKLFARY